ncbi:MAG: hypothetical protein IJS93_03285 [Clostridia bacterium]|nr:hypothetical protein [Clostridia bacterium]
MLSDKLKIRISPFVGRVIENDAQAFGFVKADDTSNKNALLNKLIPQMLRLRLAKKEEAGKLLGEYVPTENFSRVFYVLGNVKDEDEDLSVLTDEVWIRPSKETMVDFDEIGEELGALSSDVTSFVRSLLNEYSQMPQYKRQSVVFREEKERIRSAVESGSLLSFRYDGEYSKVFAYNYMYAYLLDQNNYLIGYDVNRGLIRSYALCKIDEPRVFQKKYEPTSRLLDELAKFQDSYEYGEDKAVSFKEVQ